MRQNKHWEIGSKNLFRFFLDFPRARAHIKFNEWSRWLMSWMPFFLQLCHEIGAFVSLIVTFRLIQYVFRNWHLIFPINKDIDKINPFVFGALMSMAMNGRSIIYQKKLYWISSLFLFSILGGFFVWIFNELTGRPKWNCTLRLSDFLPSILFWLWNVIVIKDKNSSFFLDFAVHIDANDIQRALWEVVYLPIWYLCGRCVGCLALWRRSKISFSIQQQKFKKCLQKVFFFLSSALLLESGSQ